MSKTPSKTKQKLTKKSAPRAKPKVIKTIQSWFEKDENGKVNKVAITVFCFLAVYPIIAFEGIKTGLFAKYDSPVFLCLVMLFCNQLYYGRPIQKAFLSERR